MGGGQKDGFVAADHQAVSLVHGTGDRSEIPVDVWDDKQILRPWSLYSIGFLLA